MSGAFFCSTVDSPLGVERLRARVFKKLKQAEKTFETCGD